MIEVIAIIGLIIGGLSLFIADEMIGLLLLVLWACILVAIARLLGYV